MPDQINCQQVLTTAFEDVAMAFGSVVAAHPVADEAVWELALDLDLIHERSCRRCSAREIATGDDPDDAEHPAIVFLLSQIHGRNVTSQEAAESSRGAS